MALEAAYAFNDVAGTTVVDLSGNGRNIDLTATNAVQVDSAGVLDGGALGKTGTGTVSLPASVRVATETDDRTVMFDANGTRGVWWVRWESTSLNTGVFGALSLDETNLLARARTQANGSPTPASPTIGTLVDGTRHNFALTYTRSTGVLAYYYDGSPVGTSTFAAGTALYTGADDLNVAEWIETGPALDNLRLFSHALTASEVAALAGTPVTGGSVVSGTALANLGGVTATIVGGRDVGGLAVASLGQLTATITATRVVTGHAVTALGRLIATATVAGALPSTRLRVTGRESLRRVAGREPRRSV